MASSTAAVSRETEVSSRSVIFTAWTAAALFGNSLNGWVASRDDRGASVGWMADRSSHLVLRGNPRLMRFQSATRRLALTDCQQVEIDDVVSLLQPQLAQFRVELDEKKQQLASLHPSSHRFTFDTACLSNDIGRLATQIALVKSKLKADVFSLLSATQQTVLDDLQVAFESYPCAEKLNDYS